ncbi:MULTISPECIES: hypothetical protein [Nitrosomonas]|uniref:Uncharacterized protein n=1 Tax=Nitrosomonas communis TaxID=44574 RepID=A0A0F7KCB8_9PROT|nr:MULTISPECIES: hypothetical protein [Nitrosomonas]AKH37236.1 hypothetical protein AAW31_04470 [Nitrosomonas communis]UVS62431.1 hypothetical protein NX761_04660 [Nitrosomonas sp. PLL12]
MQPGSTWRCSQDVIGYPDAYQYERIKRLGVSTCVIVIDKAMFHKRQDIQIAFANAGHTLEYYRLILQTLMALNPNGPRPKPSEKGKVVPSSSSLPLMKFKSFYMGSAILLDVLLTMIVF